MEPLPTHSSPEEIFRMGREALSDARFLIAGLGTLGDAEASLRAYLLRIVACLDSLFESAPAGQDEARVLFYAVNTFIPVLGLEWLPACPDGTPMLTADDLMTVQAVLREHAMQAEKRATIPRWESLMDLISESLEVFAAFGYAKGLGRCDGLLSAVEAEIWARAQAPIN